MDYSTSSRRHLGSWGRLLLPLSWGSRSTDTLQHDSSLTIWPSGASNSIRATQSPVPPIPAIRCGHHEELEAHREDCDPPQHVPPVAGSWRPPIAKSSTCKLQVISDFSLLFRLANSLVSVCAWSLRSVMWEINSDCESSMWGVGSWTSECDS